MTAAAFVLLITLLLLIFYFLFIITLGTRFTGTVITQPAATYQAIVRIRPTYMQGVESTATVLTHKLQAVGTDTMCPYIGFCHKDRFMLCPLLLRSVFFATE